jgi:uncharacterized damage-inducible protein DinB
MVTRDWCRLMAAYNAEMNRRLYAAADRLEEAQRRADRGAFFGSVHGTLSHLLWGDTTWMSRFAGWAAPGVGIQGSTTLHADWERLKADRIAADARIEAWAATLDADWLGGTLSWFSGALQRDVSRPRWVLVTHFFKNISEERGVVNEFICEF